MLLVVMVVSSSLEKRLMETFKGCGKLPGI
jgi:hypothetical protein